MFVYLFLWEREKECAREWAGKGQREREREKVLSSLRAISTEPNARLDLMTMRPWVGCATNWAIQTPLLWKLCNDIVDGHLTALVVRMSPAPWAYCKFFCLVCSTWCLYSREGGAFNSHDLMTVTQEIPLPFHSQSWKSKAVVNMGHFLSTSSRSDP